MKPRKKIKASFWIISTPLIIILTLSLIWTQWGHSLLVQFLKSKIIETSSQQNFVVIDVKDFDISLLKLQATAKNIHVEPTKDFQLINPIDINELKIQIDPFNLIIGQLTASYVKIDGVDYSINERLFKKYFLESSGKTPEIDLKPFFNILSQIPVTSYILSQTTLTAYPPVDDAYSLQKIDLTIPQLKITYKNRSIDVDTERNSLTLTNNKNVSISNTLAISAQADERKINKFDLLVERKQTQLLLQLRAQNIKTLLTNPRTKNKLNAEIYLEDIGDYISVLKNSPDRLPRLTGNMTIDLNLETQGLSKNVGSVKIDYKNFNLDTLKFGNGKVESKIINNQFVFKNMNIQHPSGLLELSKIEFQNKSPYEFKTDIQLKNFNLKDMFKSLNLTNIPASLTAEAKAQCSGQIRDFITYCKGQITAENIKVDADMAGKNNIVSLKKISAQVDGQFNSKRFAFKSLLSLKNSQFKADGYVDFADGFNIDCSSNNFDFSEVDNLANLKLKGVATGELKTQGHSEKGTIEARLSVNDFVIDSFHLGKIDSNLNYESGQLSLDNMQGQLGTSQMSGQILINLIKEKISGKMLLHRIYLEDIATLLHKKWAITLPGTGLGTGQIQFNGPLNFWKMSLDANTDFKNGTLYGESYTRIKAKIQSDGSKMHFNDVKIFKPNGFIQFTDYIDTTNANDPQMNLTVTSEGLRIDDLDHLNTYYPTLSGPANITGFVKGPVVNAKLINTITLKNSLLNNQNLGTSQFDTEINKNYFTAKGQLFNQKLAADIQLPFSNSSKYKIKAEAQQFNPLLLLPLLNLPLTSNDTSAGLTGQLDIHSDADQNGIFGSARIENLHLERGDLELATSQKSELQFRSNLSQMTPLILSGKDQTLKIGLSQSTPDNRFSVQGRLYLKPLQFLVPFTDNLSGLTEFSANIGWNKQTQQFDLKGDGLVHNAVVSTKGFPYAIKDISAYFDFAKTKVIINDLSATLNQATIEGKGYVDLIGPKNINAYVEAHSDDISLEFPPKFNTSGKVDLLFSGNWLPYTLKVDYDIIDGLITKEFTENDKRSVYVLSPNNRLPENHISKDKGALIIDAHASFTKGVTVKNSLLDAIAIGKIRAFGPPESTSLYGQLELKKGSKLIFKDKPFDIQKSLVQFDGGRDINPKISISASARHSNYDINLDINGPSKNLDIQATSQPYLARNDIFSLLTLGYVNSTADQNLSSETQQTQTGLEVLSVIGNNSDVSKKLQSKLGVNVQLSPSIDSTKNIAVPKVIVSKSLSKKVQTSFSRTLTGDQQNNEVKLQWLFRPDTSVILNYQNQPRIQESTILNSNEADTGVGGFEVEYKKEFK